MTIHGAGYVTPNLIGYSAHTQGQIVKMTATPLPGFVFAGFSGGIADSKPTIKFSMPESLELVATFIRSPFIATRGTYDGLLTQEQRAGLAVFTISANGAFSIKCTVDGKEYAGKNVLGVDGIFSGPIATANGALDVMLNLDLTGLAGLSGAVTVAGTRFSLQAYARGFRSLDNPATSYAGRYTVAFAPVASDGTIPKGIGSGAVTVDAGGMVAFTGVLGDKSPVKSFKVGLSKDGVWPLILPAYGNKGSVAGFATVSESAGANEIDGRLDWHKPATAVGSPYSAAFHTGLVLSGNRYTAPAAGKPLLALPNGGAARLVIGSFSRDFVLPNAGPATATGPATTLRVLGDHSAKPPFDLTFTLANGLFKGVYRPTPEATPISLNGAVLQGALRARGLTRSIDSLLTLPVEISAQP